MQEPKDTGTYRRRKVCLLGDTSDSRAIASLARGCDLLSHEATFLHEMADKARMATHSTGLQAGQFASRVQVNSASCSKAVVQALQPGYTLREHSNVKLPCSDGARVAFVG